MIFGLFLARTPHRFTMTLHPPSVDWSSIWFCVQNNCAIVGLAMLRTPSHDLHWSSRAVSRYREYSRQTRDTRRRNLRNQSAHSFRTKDKHCLYILGGCNRHAGLFYYSRDTTGKAWGKTPPPGRVAPTMLPPKICF